MVGIITLKDILWVFILGYVFGFVTPPIILFLKDRKKRKRHHG